MLRLSLFAAFLLLMSGGCSKKTAEKPVEKSKSDEGGVPTAAPAKQAPSKEAPTEKLLDNLNKNQPSDKKLGEKEESDEKGGRKDTEPGTFDTTVTPPASMTVSPKTGLAETKMKSGEAKKKRKN